MNWSGEDNKNYRGKIDRIFVSQTESYEVAYYVDDYLKTRNYAISPENRKKVRDKMETFTGRAPVKRVDMDAHLDRGWKT